MLACQKPRCSLWHMAIYFIRHGQSEFNAAFQGEVDPFIFDAPLTTLGFEQAAEARASVASLGITRVITSPLKRAIQTAQTIFDGAAPIEVQQGHHELLKFSGDVGRSPEELSRDFPKLAFEHLPSQWWHAGSHGNLEVPEEPLHLFQARVASFVAGLSELGDERVAIVGHGNAFQEIIGFMLSNCQVHQYK